MKAQSFSPSCFQVRARVWVDHNLTEPGQQAFMPQHTATAVTAASTTRGRADAGCRRCDATTRDATEKHRRCEVQWANWSLAGTGQRARGRPLGLRPGLGLGSDLGSVPGAPRRRAPLAPQAARLALPAISSQRRGGGGDF